MQNRKVSSFVRSAVLVAVAASGMVSISGKPALAQVDRANVGDSPDNPGPLATDVSAKLTHTAIRHAAKKVADWQLAQSETKFNQQWTFAALYDGFLAASTLTGDAKYHDAMVKMGAKFDWKLINNPFPATLHAGSCLGLVIRYKATERYPRACELIITCDDPTEPEKLIELLAATIWSDCGCNKCCDKCKSGHCDTRHCDPCCCQKCGGDGENDDGDEG